VSWLSLFVHDPKAPLVFTTGAFFLFFTVFLCGFVLVRRMVIARLAYVLGFSLFFYYKCSGAFVGVLLATTVADYAIAKILHRTESEKWRKALVALSVVAGLGLLGYFKYTNFVLANVAAARGVPFEPLDIFLPIGISFYTFQSLSFIVDVYRREVGPPETVLDYAFSLAFFPHIVAGPIVRARDLLPQIRALHEPSADELASGLFRVIQGVIKKALIADYIGIYCDLIFDSPGTYGAFEVALAIYGYAFQIYFDFSGYSDIAIGLARILGFRFPENFNSPYRATSITEFWRRWHMTLSTWLRDYLYVPLGGNRQGKVRQYVNLLLTMLLGGLWHGASWSFVIWGGMHGAGLAIHKALANRFPLHSTAAATAILRHALGWVVTFHFVLAAWVFFRARDLDTVWLVFSRLGTPWELDKVGSVIEVRRWLFVAMGAAALFSFLPTGLVDKVERAFTRVPMPARAFALLCVVQLVLQVQSSEVQPFIYFQF
jgi:D-alanyl-lipoteichoic acid acyltransferase DltB (MBOAT superfamily)